MKMLAAKAANHIVLRSFMEAPPLTCRKTKKRRGGSFRSETRWKYQCYEIKRGAFRQSPSAKA
jgi:hypothetical protein